MERIRAVRRGDPNRPWGWWERNARNPVGEGLLCVVEVPHVGLDLQAHSVERPDELVAHPGVQGLNPAAEGNLGAADPDVLVVGLADDRPEEVALAQLVGHPAKLVNLSVQLLDQCRSCDHRRPFVSLAWLLGRGRRPRRRSGSRGRAGSRRYWPAGSWSSRGWSRCRRGAGRGPGASCGPCPTSGRSCCGWRRPGPRRRGGRRRGWCRPGSAIGVPIGSSTPSASSIRTSWGAVSARISVTASAILSALRDQAHDFLDLAER